MAEKGLLVMEQHAPFTLFMQPQLPRAHKYSGDIPIILRGHGQAARR
ncbi:MAG: hypothetical protein BWY96_03114 [Spirochaetes bacterium ADurb.BinA120]|nr:MAG: hypothetical protein BWY96_03114 [Spirochaetes bacterium ADurb.BinA120]